MNADPSPSRPDEGDDPRPRRLFVHEPGWRIGMKVGNEREFCYMMAPGQDYYHRLYDGEVFLRRADERLCLACAERRGLLSFAPRALRESLGAVEFGVEDSASEIEIRLTDEIDWNR
jgi:hypothetical protein